MMSVLFDVFLSAFFIYGIYSAMSEVRRAVRRLIRRRSAIDKNSLRRYNIISK